MTIRTSVVEVRELITLNVEDAVIEHNYIKTANVIVDTYLATSTLSTAVLIEIEKYLATHFAALSAEGGGVIGESMTGASSQLANIYSAGFNSTRFGQMAISLDFTGTLSSLGNTKLKAIFRSI